jgi:hypothetical protein
VLLEVWTKAHQLIASAKELFVVGYSLNPVDHPARLLFGLALSENSTIEQVTVIAPDAAEWASFLGGLNKEMVLVREKFEEWVLRAPPISSGAA